MKTRRSLLAGILGAGLGLSAARAWAGAPDLFAGAWNGVLQAGSTQLRLRLTIEADLRVALFSLDQGDEPIPGDQVRIDGDWLTVRFPSIKASYEAKLMDGRLEGEFTQGGKLPLVMVRGEPPAAAPQPLDAARLAALRAEAGSPALAAAAATRDGRRLSLADGVRALGQEAPVTTGDLWHIGSITKSMTATLVGRCVDEGAVRWEDTAGGVLGAVLPDMRAEYRDLSFLHLLSHRGGLAANIGAAELLRLPREEADARASRVAFARIALGQAPIGPKEATFGYSNNGYVLAGAMLEAKLGQSWEELMRTRLFAPLGLASAGFGAPGTAGRLDEPVGHAPGLRGALRPHPPGEGTTDNPAALGPAGRVHLSLDDLLAYLAAHRDRSALLRPETWDRLHTPPFGGDYALGWIRRGESLWHNGSNTLWYAEVLVDPARGVVAAAAANDGRVATATPAVGEALLGAAEACLG